MNLQLELYKFQREFWAKFPPEKAAIMQEATQVLAKEFQNRRTLRVDDEAPDFVLKNTGDQEISLSEKLQQGAVLLLRQRPDFRTDHASALFHRQRHQCVGAPLDRDTDRRRLWQRARSVGLRALRRPRVPG